MKGVGQLGAHRERNYLDEGGGMERCQGSQEGSQGGGPVVGLSS